MNVDGLAPAPYGPLPEPRPYRWPRWKLFVTTVLVLAGCSAVAALALMIIADPVGSLHWGGIVLAVVIEVFIVSGAIGLAAALLTWLSMLVAARVWAGAGQASFRRMSESLLFGISATVLTVVVGTIWIPSLFSRPSDLLFLVPVVAGCAWFWTKFPRTVFATAASSPASGPAAASASA